MEQAPGRTCGPVERSPGWIKFCVRTCDHIGGPTLEDCGPKGLHPLERTYTGALCEELRPVGRTHIEEAHGRWSSMGRTPHWDRGRV